MTMEHAQDAVFVAERQVNLELGQWLQVPDRDWLSTYAVVQLSLAASDAMRAVEYDTARRRAHQTVRIEQDRLEYFRTHVLNEADAARRWWLDRHSSNLVDLASWDQFDKIILPLVESHHDPQSAARRVAAVLMDVVRRLEEDPRRHRQLISTAVELFDQMGWHDLADAIEPKCE